MAAIARSSPTPGSSRPRCSRGVPRVSEEDATTLNTVTFAESDGRTTLTILVEATSRVARDAIVASGMESGLQDAMDLLEEVARSLG